MVQFHPQGKLLLWSPSLSTSCTLYLKEFLTLVTRKNQGRIGVLYPLGLGALAFVLSFCLGKGHGKLLGKLATNTISYKYMCKEYREYVRKKGKNQNGISSEGGCACQASASVLWSEGSGTFVSEKLMLVGLLNNSQSNCGTYPGLRAPVS